MSMSDDYHNWTYLMSGLDSHLVPDEDDFKFNNDDDDHHHHQVAPKPKVTKTHLFDLNCDLKDDDTALTMINSKRDGDGDEDADADEDVDVDVVVPHDSQLPASKHPPPKEAEPPALVPSLSVCSNHLPSPNPKRKSRVQKRKRVAKVDKKLRALQGLIPNCNDKVDGASILDEAIVYVKTLQLQLQMMTMPMPMPFPIIGIPPPFMPPPLMLPPFPAFPCPQTFM